RPSTATTAASSSSIRSSTSFCWIAALIRRITPSRSFSPAFVAAFMSSVRVCLRVMGRLSGGAAERRKAGDAWACRLPWKLAWLPRRARDGRSVQALALGDVARGAARLALHGSRGLALALLGRLLVVLALAGLGQAAGLLAGALEAAQGKLDRLVFAAFDGGHGTSGGGLRRPAHGEPHMIARARAGPQAGGCRP